MPGIAPGALPGGNIWKKSICWNCSCICICMRIGIGKLGFCSITASCCTSWGLNVGASPGAPGIGIGIGIGGALGASLDAAGVDSALPSSLGASAGALGSLPACIASSASCASFAAAFASSSTLVPCSNASSLRSIVLAMYSRTFLRLASSILSVSMFWICFSHSGHKKSCSNRYVCTHSSQKDVWQHGVITASRSSLEQ